MAEKADRHSNDIKTLEEAWSKIASLCQQCSDKSVDAALIAHLMPN